MLQVKTRGALMELLQLTYFCDAAESENFSLTARKFNVPPSGISQTIKRLEDELSVKLFVRESNRITLSEQGRIFYEGAKEALTALLRARSRIAEADTEPSGEIRIALRTHRRTATEAIERFQRNYPGVSFIITHGQEKGIYDFIITSNADNINNYKKKTLLKEKMLLALPDETSFKGNDLYNYRDRRFITMVAGTDYMRSMTEICLNAGFSPDIAIQCDDPYYVRKYVEMGMGVALAPSISWRGMFSEKVKLVDLGDIYRTVYLHHKPEAEMPLASKLFLTALLETFEK
jgi:DNA-binding transcriptional LysR family regulator